MNILHLQGICGFTIFAALASTILIRRRRLMHEDVGPLFSTFMAASTLPVAAHLCSFALPMPRGPNPIVMPDLYSLYISVAGLILLVSSGVTIGQLFIARTRPDVVAVTSTRRSGKSRPTSRKSGAPSKGEQKRNAGTGP